MSKRNSKNNTQKGAEGGATLWDNIRWIAGFALIVSAIYLICALGSHIFYWRADLSSFSPYAQAVGDVQFNNFCSETGALIANELMGKDFGIMALVIPILLGYFGVCLYSNKALRLSYVSLSALMIMILGSLTLGFAFGTSWDLFGSGLGGGLGLAMSDSLVAKIGNVGVVLAIISGWILVGIFINRNFIKTVDNASGQVLGGISNASTWAFGHIRQEYERLKAERAAKRAEEEVARSVNQAPTSETEKESTDGNTPDVETTPKSVESTALEASTENREPIATTENTTPSMATAQGSDVTSNTTETTEAATDERDTTNGADDTQFSAQATTQSSAESNAVGSEQIATTSTATAQERDILPTADDDYPFKEPDAPLCRATGAEGEPVTTAQAGEMLGLKIDDKSANGLTPQSDDETTTDERDANTDGDGLKVTVEMGKVRTIDPTTPDTTDEDLGPYDPKLDLFRYSYPNADLLDKRDNNQVIDEEEIFQNKESIRETLLNFGIPIIEMHATVGPTVTLYEIVQERSVKISRITGLEDDLAQNLKAQSVRIIAPIPGRGTIGIEVPNKKKQTVSMHSAICSEEFQKMDAELPVVIGRTIQNQNFTFDLTKMPHLLVAGATGQGKSVGLNAIIASLLYRKHPSELKFVLIDPKMVEFSLYNKLERHFLAKMESEEDAIVTDPKTAVNTLNSLCTEMSSRLELCKKAEARNIVEYNEKFVSRQLNPENGHRYLPYIVVIIDEFADLIMTAKEVETPVMRLAQKARAVGIHLIVATQRPDVKVITGSIKANFPARIAFRVMQMTDSRTIIDQPGANLLIGRGDMLFLNGGEPTRIQCAFIDTPEVTRIVNHIGNQQGYAMAYNLPEYSPETAGEMGGGGSTPNFGGEECGPAHRYDPKFARIAIDAVASGFISTSHIQRHYSVGFNRAGRIMMQLERAGIVGKQVGAKPREIRFYDVESLKSHLESLGVSLTNIDEEDTTLDNYVD